MERETKILLVDDESFVRLATQMALSAEAEKRYPNRKFEFFGAENAQDGGRKFAELFRDFLRSSNMSELLLISDLNMPYGDDGLNLLQQVKEKFERLLEMAYPKNERAKVRTRVRFALFTGAKLKATRVKMDARKLHDIALIGKGENDELFKFCFPDSDSEQAAA